MPALNFGTPVPPENTDAYCFGWSTYTHDFPWFLEPPAGDPFALNAAVEDGALFVAFSVDTSSVGMKGSAVRSEASQVPSEAAGDVFESSPAVAQNLNSLIADEFALGLAVTPLDDLNGLVIPDEFLLEPQGPYYGTPVFADLQHWVSTDGLPGADAPIVFFSIAHTVTQGNLGGGYLGDYVLQTAAYNGGLPAWSAAWTPQELGLPGSVEGGLDELDALYIENPDTYPEPPLTIGPLVYFSLAAGSQSLQNVPLPSPILNPFTASTGCDPGDIIGVCPAGPAGGAQGQARLYGPVVVILANTLGLRGDAIANDGLLNEDDLDGLHMSIFQFHPGEMDPVWVDFANIGAETGTEGNPFHLLKRAFPLAARGGTIVIKGDMGDAATDEAPLRITQEVRLNSNNGTVRVGVAGG